MLTRTLTTRVREFLSEDGSTPNRKRPIEIELQFATSAAGGAAGAEVANDATLLEIIDLDKLPDTLTQRKKKSRSNVSPQLADLYFPRNQGRELVTSFAKRNLYMPLQFHFKNTGAIGARDVFVDLRFRADKDAQLVVARSADVMRTGLITWQSFAEPRPQNFGEVSQIDGEWRYTFEIRALQPQREYTSPRDIALATNKSATVHIAATIYAEALAEPIQATLTKNNRVTKKQVQAQEIHQMLTARSAAFKSSGT